MIKVGTAGWSIPRAVTSTFPYAGTHLERYSRILPCVEINSSFYRPHARAVYEKWAGQTPASFRFSVKLPRSITHDQRLRRARPLLLTFLDEVQGLGTKLGPLLVQLPPSLEFNARAARAFFSLFREYHDAVVVCEPRHQSWFTDTANGLLESLHVGRVAADPALGEGAGHPGGWTGMLNGALPGAAYYRLHGSPRMYWSRYSAQQVSELRAELSRLSSRATDAWCIFDNTAGGAAMENALEIRTKNRRAQDFS
jgi:uncharacterized protein YecE (DUF72 family)